MKTKIINTYSYSELSDVAKEKARNWFVGISEFDSECIIEDAKTIGALIGLNIEHVYYRGFWSQGDGACFTGTYKYAKGGIKKLVEYAPQDKELQRIAKTLQDAQQRNFYRLRAIVQHRGFYYHSGCMSIDVFDNKNQYRDIGDYEDDISQALKDFADWIYSNLEKDYEFQTSDEQVEEMILCNEYQFDEEGNIA